MHLDYPKYCVYVLWSSAHQKRYVGQTSDLINRFKSHNILANKGWTIRYRPWTVVYVRFFTSKTEALGYEKFLKSGQGRVWMSKNIEFKK